MKVLLLILLFSLPQDVEWKQIKEISGPIPGHPGLTVETYATEIARGEDTVKLKLRLDFPEGAPVDAFRNSVPFGFDISSINRMVFKVELNCRIFEIKAVKEEGEFYQFNGKKHKSKEPPVKIESGNIFAQYFCEQGETPTKAPTLKPK